MDKVMYGIAVDSFESATALGVSKDHIAHMKMFFSGTITIAKRYLAAIPEGTHTENVADTDAASSESASTNDGANTA